MSAAARRANAFSNLSSGPASIAARAKRIRRSAHRSATTSSFTGLPGFEEFAGRFDPKQDVPGPHLLQAGSLFDGAERGVVSRWLLSCPMIAANVSARMESKFRRRQSSLHWVPPAHFRCAVTQGPRHRARFHLSIPKIGTPSDRGGSDDAGGRPRSLHRVLQRARAHTKRPPRSVATECPANIKGSVPPCRRLPRRTRFRPLQSRTRLRLGRSRVRHPA